MEITQTPKGSCLTLGLVGQFWERSDLGVFQGAVQTALQQPFEAIVLDLTRLTFVSSIGLGAFVNMSKAARDAKKLFVLYNAAENVLETLEVSEIHRIVTVVATSAELQALLDGATKPKT